jgi:hypothetical protein
LSPLVGSKQFRVGTWTGKLQIFFKSSNFFPFILQQKLTPLDLASYCGGSLGLFLGFSALSAVEFLYYLTLRLICMRRQRRRTATDFAKEEIQKKNLLVEYLEYSTIHGFSQIGMKKRHFIERFDQHERFIVDKRFKLLHCRAFWIFFVIIAIIFCGKTIESLFKKYKSASVRIKYDDVQSDFQEMVFPAITFNNELLMKFTYVNILRVAAFRKHSIRDIISTLGDDRFVSLVLGSLCLTVCL